MPGMKHAVIAIETIIEVFMSMIKTLIRSVLFASLFVFSHSVIASAEETCKSCMEYCIDKGPINLNLCLNVCSTPCGGLEGGKKYLPKPQESSLEN